MNIFRVVTKYGKALPVFEVHLDDRPPVHMSVESNSQNNNRRVVIVESRKFVELWKAEDSQRALSCGNQNSWRADRKYTRVNQELFSKPHDDPVFMARVICKLPTLACIEDGVTRTIWLLANGCKEFPVECDAQSSIYLHRAAGAHESGIFSVEALYASLLGPR